MPKGLTDAQYDALARVPPDQTVLIAGPTASGKSALAMALAEISGGVIVNADASQVYDCWRVITARPSEEDENRTPHALYGHIAATQDYSAGHWLREVTGLLGRGERLIIVGGTGLYFTALTEGLAEIPPVSADVRTAADSQSLPALLKDLDPVTQSRIDTANRARVQRAWEVHHATGRTLADWQDSTPAPHLPIEHCAAFVLDAPKDWLTPRIERRFDAMMDHGALEEVAAQLNVYDPSRPAHRAIGVPELVAHLRGALSLDQAKVQATIATRQFAKRQRTWFRAKMRHWTWLSAE